MRCVTKLSTKARTFSGIQPTGTLHLGNYFGAVQQWVEDVKSIDRSDIGSERIFSVVDMHALTLPQDPDVLRKNILTMTASLIGCGLDPEKSIIFQQSHVSQHYQLCWILGTLSTVPSLNRLSQYKEKSRNLKEVPLGLFIYPVLQAADILLYKATNVPVGEDNLQNVEVTRRLASLFNNRFKRNVFPLPEPILVKEESSRRIKSLRTPEKKMSKSDQNQKSCLYILDDPETIRLKIKKSVTDMKSEVTFDPELRPGVSNLVCIHSRITGKDTAAICDEVQGMDTGKYKILLTDIIIDHFAPIREETTYLLKNKDHLEAILSKGAERARHIAADTMREVNQTIGLQ